MSRGRQRRRPLRRATRLSRRINRVTRKIRPMTKKGNRLRTHLRSRNREWIRKDKTALTMMTVSMSGTLTISVFGRHKTATSFWDDRHIWQRLLPRKYNSMNPKRINSNATVTHIMTRRGQILSRIKSIMMTTNGTAIRNMTNLLNCRNRVRTRFFNSATVSS